MSKSLFPLIVLAIFICATALHAEDKQKSESESKSDALQAKTIWTGVAQGDPRKANSESHPARLRVLERDGEKFSAELWIQRKGGLRAGLKVDGRVKGDRIALKPVKILNGVWGDDVLKEEIPGQIKGEAMILKPVNKNNMAGTIELKLDHEAKGGRDGDEPKKEK